MKTEIKWGLIIGVAALIWISLEYVFGLHTTYAEIHPYVTLLWIPFSIFLLVLALREKKRKDYKGKMTYKQGVISGIIIAVIIALLSPVTLYLFNTFVNPEFFSTMIEMAVNRASELGEDVAAARSDAEGYFNMGSYIFQSVLGSVVGTVVTTLIAMIFIRSK